MPTAGAATSASAHVRAPVYLASTAQGARTASAHVTVGGSAIVGVATDIHRIAIPETHWHDQSRDQPLATVEGFTIGPVAAVAIVAVSARARMRFRQPKPSGGS
jgi:hypothetical protein